MFAGKWELNFIKLPGIFREGMIKLYNKKNYIKSFWHCRSQRQLFTWYASYIYYNQKRKTKYRSDWQARMYLKYF